MEVQLHANICYGPDNPTLWPQPWVKMFCHLGAIPRKPNNANNPLSIMWWDPTRDDFKSFSSSLIDGLGELSGSRLLLLQTMMSNMEDRIEQHKRASPFPNKLLPLLTRAMQDTFIHLSSLKTTFTQMRIGITKFQWYYLEIHGCLDYLELYKPRMDGAKPAAETVANCIGAITNILHIVQDFHM
ncbi:hypothetical protein BYT27DRAFT_7257876 [Phlegmacium glaucopus]|nr:hypothetical protein BYT27DRAFT_7257876 [Phlegmacium glaucopus]